MLSVVNAKLILITMLYMTVTFRSVFQLCYHKPCMC